MMSTSRRNHFMIRLTNGKVLVGGGFNANGNVLSSAEIYDPSSGLFTSIADMPEPRSQAKVATLPNGNVIVMGGEGASGSGTLRTAIILDISSNTWSSVSSQMQIGHGDGSTAVTLNDGRIVIAGGWTTSGGQLFGISQTDIYDPTTGLFSNGPSLTLQRGDVTAHVLADGKVVFIGGSDGSDVTNSVEVLDPTTNLMIRQANTMFHSRYGHSSAQLQDGRVLIIGGNYWAGNTGEIFTE
jgi:N-acetylneuraminic acid mutarotase